MTTNPKRVEIHTHVFPKETLGKAGRYGPEVLVENGERFLRVGAYKSRPSGMSAKAPSAATPKERLALMDEEHIDVMGVTISPLFYLYWAEEGIAFSTVQNEALARFCDADRDRLFFIATLPLQDIDASLKELDHATADLGSRGINVGTDDLGGRDLDDPYFWPLYEAAEERGLPLFVHPYPLGIQTEDREPLADRYNMSWLLGYVYQETLAVAHLMYGGVLDRFPGLKVCVPHGGGMIPYQFGRLEYGASRMKDVKAQRPLRDYLANFYFDICVHDVAARRFLVEFMGPDHLVVGSNYGGWDQVNGFSFLDELHLGAEDAAKIAGSNAVELFALGR